MATAKYAIDPVDEILKIFIHCLGKILEIKRKKN